MVCGVVSQNQTFRCFCHAFQGRSHVCYNLERSVAWGEMNNRKKPEKSLVTASIRLFFPCSPSFPRLFTPHDGHPRWRRRLAER